MKAGEVWSQSAGESKALKDLSRQRWSKCWNRLTKVMEKDSLSVGGYYVKSLYFFSTDNPDFNLDSAYKNLGQSMFYYDQLSLRQRERLAKLPLDTISLRELRYQIDSAAFERARKVDTEESYTHFLEYFPSSINYGDAILLLQDAAYKAAQAENSYESFDRYLKKYPQSNHTEEALGNYDRLLFEARTQDGRLATYRSYLEDNPRSPYRLLAEGKVFEISTASGDPETFVKFIHDYPQSPWSVRAKNILYYVLKDMEGRTFPESFMTDSLQNIHQLNGGYIVPFFTSGHFGFMDSKGMEIIPAMADEIDHQYLCGNIIEDVLAMDDNLVARNRASIYQGDIDEIDDPGFGFLFLTPKEGDKIVLHKSGFILAKGEIDDIQIPGGRFMALKIQGHWSLYSLTGRRLLDAEWDEIKTIGQVLVLKKENQWYLLTYPMAGLIADQQAPEFTASYDEVKSWPDGNYIWVKRGDQEGLLENNLTIKFPLENQTLKPLAFGIELRSSEGVKVFDYSYGELGFFEDVKSNMNWLGVKTNNEWRLFDRTTKSLHYSAFDSLSFLGTFLIGHKRDSIQVFFDKKKSLRFKNVGLSFIAAKDSLSYLVVTESSRRILYSSQGVKMFESAVDNIQFSEKGIFMVTKKEKKGLVTGNGKMLLPITYDAIGDGDGTYLPLLRSMKFGLYDIRNKREIKPAYDKNLKKYNDELFIAYKNSGYGIIDTKGKTVFPFDYDDIQYWNDSSAFVKRNNIWQLVEIANNTVILDQIKAFQFVSDTKQEKVIIAQQANGFGVISTSRGPILPFTFTDIINIGSKEDPLYFTEKHVEEASIFVVIYFDRNGKLIRRQVYEPEEYEKIYCSNN